MGDVTEWRRAAFDFLQPGGSAQASRRHPPGLGPLLDLVGPERSASAHGPPVNGAAHLLVFFTETEEKLVRVFTTETSYTPDEATWSKMKAAGTPIGACVLTGIFDDNLLATDGGPFMGPWIGFTIQQCARVCASSPTSHPVHGSSAAAGWDASTIIEHSDDLDHLA